MRFVVGCPSVDDLIIRITDRQRSTRQQITRNVRFVDIQHRRILHDDCGIVEFCPIIVGFYIYLIDLLCTFLHQLEHDAFSFGIAVRGTFLRQGVLFFKFQTSHGVRHFAGGPALDQTAVCIADFQLCTGQFLAVGDVPLRDIHGGTEICVCSVHDLPRDLLSLIGELYIHRGAVQQVTRRGGDFHNAVSAAILAASTSRACRVNVIFSANRHVHIEPREAVGIGGAAGGQLCTGIHQFRSICGINVIHGVEFIHRTGQIGQRLSVLLVNAYTDFADFITGLFWRGEYTGVFKHERLPGLVGIRGILDVHDAVRTFLVAVLLVADNSFCQHNVIFLVVPAEFHSVALLGQHKTIRRFDLGNGVLAQRQGHGDFALGAIMGNFQEIIGCLCAGGAEFYFVHLPLRTSGNSCYQVAGFVPVSALAVRCGNVG